jgi:hypothetical protein
VIWVQIPASAYPGGEADRVFVGTHSDDVDAWRGHVGILIEVGTLRRFDLSGSIRR